MYEQIASRAREATIGACWRQWRALTGEGLTAGQRPARSIIDPEALVVASLAMRHREQRLRDILYWWTREGTHLLSVQRLRTIARLFPESTLQGGVEWFAALAVEAGDARWKRLATGTSADEPVRPGKGPRELHLIEPSTMMLRLRAGFGVGAKADLMSFLIGSSSALRKIDVWTTARTISAAIGYSRASVSRAVADMSLARFIEGSADRPPMYSIDVESWARSLRLEDPYRSSGRSPGDGESTPFDVPPWRFWGHVHAFLLACAEWSRGAAQQQAAPVVHASHARDVVERFERYLAWNGIQVPDARMLAGERYLDPFVEMVDRVVGLTETSL